MSRSLNGQTWTVHDQASADEQRKAALYTVLQGRTVAERRQLLDILGLLPKRLITEHGMRGYRQGCRCPDCRKANTERTYRQKRASVPATTTADAPINTTKGDQ